MTYNPYVSAIINPANRWTVGLHDVLIGQIVGAQFYSGFHTCSR
jgi:uncharacterized protein (DUF779 family)